MSNLDQLSSACFTLPCRFQAEDQQQPRLGGFDPIPDYESDWIPCQLRYAAFSRASRQAGQLFEKCLKRIYSPLFSDLNQFISDSYCLDKKEATLGSHLHGPSSSRPSIPEPFLFIPGLGGPIRKERDDQTVKSERTSIRTAFLISSASPTLSSFPARLARFLSSTGVEESPSSSSCIYVTLHPSECPNLTATTRIIVARFIANGSRIYNIRPPASSNQKQESNLYLLSRWYSETFESSSDDRPKLVLHLPAMEAFDPTVLSDVLSSLQAFIENVQEVGGTCLPLVLLLGVTSPSGSSERASAPAPWTELVPKPVLQNMDLERFSLPSRSLVWEGLVNDFLLSPNKPLSLGPRTFDFLQRGYWERDANIDSLMDGVQLAYLHHFSTNPLSAFTVLEELTHSYSKYSSSWEPKMYSRLRLELSSPSASGPRGGGIWVPRPLNRKRKRSSQGLDPFSCSRGATGEAGKAIQDPDSSPSKHLKAMLESDGYLLTHLSDLFHHRKLYSQRRDFATRAFMVGFRCIRQAERSGSEAGDGHGKRLREEEEESLVLTRFSQQVLACCHGSRANFSHSFAQLSASISALCNNVRKLDGGAFESFVDEMVILGERCLAKTEEILETEGRSESDPDTEQEVEPESSSLIFARDLQAYLKALRSYQQRMARTISGELCETPTNGEEEGKVGADTNPGSEMELEDAERKMESKAKDKAASNPVDPEGKQAKFFQEVQKRLELEEKVLSMKREVADWIGNFIKGKLKPSLNRLLDSIYVYNASHQLTTLLDPTPRSNLLLSLQEPNLLLDIVRRSSALDQEELDLLLPSEDQGVPLPDVCRLYRLYRDCGKLINLADWFDAFVASLQSEEVAKRKRGRAAEEESGATDSGGEDVGEQENEKGKGKRDVERKTGTIKENHEEGRVDDEGKSSRRSTRSALKGRPRTSAKERKALQIRFSLAVNELGKMGFLKTSRRKADHVGKTVWDLVPC
ncbi:hypothetical protein IE53DRAFT_101491 [Violaceomyces palustris]|uniref:Uncharacterized protein n=1 Tax=Violaceomyces palustris TaxID=1673888 RepID=A0ACD0NWV7_9BASI|nr:hypothetical protein IE53DRAFT_101491 [Violaceomyces palustris]